MIRANHERANNFVLATQTIEVQNGQFSAALKMPADTPWGKVIVRAVADSNRKPALGTLAIPIVK